MAYTETVSGTINLKPAKPTPKVLKYVPANIKSPASLAVLLEGGAVFYDKWGCKYFYDEDDMTNPFRAGGEHLNSWCVYAELLLEEYVYWYEDIPEKGVLCKVTSDLDSIPDGSNIVVVTYYSNCVFRDMEGHCYNSATPLTKDELMEYVL